MLLLSWVVVAAAYSQVLPREIHINKNADLLTTSDNRKSVTKNHLPKAWSTSPSFKRPGSAYNLIDLSCIPLVVICSMRCTTNRLFWNYELVTAATKEF